MKRLNVQRRAAAVMALACVGVLLTSPPSSAATSGSVCSDSHQSDTIAAKSSTSKSGWTASGVGAGIDSYLQGGIPTTCDVNSPYDADNMQDTYLSGRVYEYTSGTYNTCADRVPGWRGYWSTTNQTWSIDLAHDISNSCGWETKPIKVRSIAKGLWTDGTILSVTAFVTDTAN